MVKAKREQMQIIMMEETNITVLGEQKNKNREKEIRMIITTIIIINQEMILGSNKIELNSIGIRIAMI